MHKEALIDYYNKYGTTYQIIYDNINKYKLYYDTSMKSDNIIVTKQLDQNTINYIKINFPGYLIRYYTNDINDPIIPYAIGSNIVQLILYEPILNDNVMKTSIYFPFKTLYFYKYLYEIDPNIINQFIKSNNMMQHVPHRYYFIKNNSA